MKTVLDSAHTWFLETCTYRPGGELIICLVEGIKGPKRLPVEIEDTVLGPYFPVTVEPSSRSAEVRFEWALAVFTFNESYDTASLDIEVDETDEFVCVVKASAFSEFSSRVTGLKDIYPNDPKEYFIWCEDQIFQVVASAPPEVSFTSSKPNLSIERVATWSAS